MDNNLRNFLTKYGFSFKKAYGQNFLTDNGLLDDIVLKSGVTKNDTVLEIGCGAGALTKVLAHNAKNVVGYEIDLRLKPVLTEVLGEENNVEIVYKDIMKEDLSILEQKLGEYVVVANLPYYITTPIIMEFIEKAKNVKSLIIMVQEEVAKRLVAKNGSSDYGAITVAINLRGNAKIIKTVGRELFTPIPNVDSAVVKIDIDREKNNDVDLEWVRTAVKCGFNNRRKMLVNNIMNTFGTNRETAENILIKSNIPLTARGETLSDTDFIKLSTTLKEELE